MSVDEELQEHAEHAKDPFDKMVAVTMAVIAAMLAIDGVMSHLFTTEELLLQQKASDQWSYYQAKSIRRYNSEVARDTFLALDKPTVSQGYAKNADKYRDDMTDIQKEAKQLESESHVSGGKAERYHFGEVFLEIAIVLASLAILTHRSLIYWLAVTSALGGTAIALTALLVH